LRAQFASDEAYRSQFGKALGGAGESPRFPLGLPNCLKTGQTLCRVVPVDQKRFEFLVQHNPHFAVQVMSVMAERLRRVMGVDA
jgi:hypothetical protein